MLHPDEQNQLSENSLPLLSMHHLYVNLTRTAGLTSQMNQIGKHSTLVPLVYVILTYIFLCSGS